MQDIGLTVGEVDVVEVDPARDRAQRLGARPVADLGLRVEHRAHLHHRGSGCLQLPVHIRELLQGLEHELEQVDRGDQRPDGEAAAGEQPRADHEHGARRDGAEELDRREEHREQLLCVDVGRAVLVVELVELALELALAVERLDDRHPRHRLGDLRGDRGDAVSHLELSDGGLALEPAREHERRRQDHHRDKAQPPVDHEEHDHGRRQEHDVRDEGRQALGERVRDRVHVAGHPGDDPARPLLREVAQRERRQMVEEVAAQAEDDALADPRKTSDQHELAQPADQVHEQVRDHDDGQRVLVALGDAVVDRGPDEQPAARLGGGARGGDRDETGDDQPPTGEVSAQAAEAGAAMRHRARLRTGSRTRPCHRSGRPAGRPRPRRRRRARLRGRPVRAWTGAASRR